MDRRAHGHPSRIPDVHVVTVAIGSRCTACGVCITTCPEKALSQAPRHPDVAAARCTDCLACVEVCPADAIHLVAIDVTRDAIC